MGYESHFVQRRGMRSYCSTVRSRLQ